jgi:hypothetical protein
MFFNPTIAVHKGEELSNSSLIKSDIKEAGNISKIPLYSSGGKEKPISDFVWFYSIYLDLITTDFKFNILFYLFIGLYFIICMIYFILC